MCVYEYNLGFYFENFLVYFDSIVKCVDIYISMFSFIDICVEVNIFKINKNKCFLNLIKRV